MRFKQLQLTFLQTVFNVTKEGAETWQRLEIGGIVRQYVRHSLGGIAPTNFFDRHLSPLNVDEMLKLYCVEVVRHMQPIVDSNGPSFTSGLSAFLIPLQFYITSRGFYGPEFPAEAIYPPFLAFDDGFSKLAAEVPRIFIPQTYAGRTEITRQFREYLAAPHTPCEAMVLTEQGALDAGMSPDDAAGFFFSMLWPVTGNVGYAIFWTLYLLMKDGPGGMVNLQTEIDTAVASWKAAHPGSDPFKDGTSLFTFFKASKFPYFDSLVKEMLRFTSLSFSLRRIDVDKATLIGEKGQVFTFSEGDMIACYTRSTHLDEEVYKDAHKFIPERFMEDVRYTKNGKDLPNSFMPFGGGVTMVSDLSLCWSSLLKRSTTQSVPDGTLRPRKSRSL
jgi:cytochrome P450